MAIVNTNNSHSLNTFSVNAGRRYGANTVVPITTSLVTIRSKEVHTDIDITADATAKYDRIIPEICTVNIPVNVQLRDANTKAVLYKSKITQSTNSNTGHNLLWNPLIPCVEDVTIKTQPALSLFVHSVKIPATTSIPHVDMLPHVDGYLKLNLCKHRNLVFV